MASERHGAAKSTEKSGRLFEKQLIGEQPLQWETARNLYDLSKKLLEMEPWEFLADDELVLIRDPVTGEICYCSIMGELGQVLSLQVYVGAESYRFFRKMAHGVPVTFEDFLAEVRGVAVEFVTPGSQRPPDRELLEAFGHPKERGRRGPIFRANRPGYHPWYVTEDEGRLLLYCLRAILVFCGHLDELGEMDTPDYWQDEDIFPLLTPDTEDTTNKNFRLQLVRASEPPAFVPVAAELDEDLIGEILRLNLPQRGILETDHFFTGAVLGEKNERKTCLYMALVSDSDSHFAFQPELGKPEDETGQLLVRALLGAMRAGRSVPREVRVRRKGYKIVLSALSERMGFDVRVVKSLPAVDDFKSHLRTRTGGSD